MGRCILFLLGGLLIGLFSEARVIQAHSAQLDMRARNRPSCEMLAWRWIMQISRMSESDIVLSKALAEKTDTKKLSLIASRVSGESAEGGEDLVLHKVVFKAPEIHSEDFKLDRIDGAVMKWENVTSNMTDRVRYQVNEGEIVVETEMPYEQYCFYQGISKIEGLLKGEPIELQWNTKSVNLVKYFDLLD